MTNEKDYKGVRLFFFFFGCNIPPAHKVILVAHYHGGDTGHAVSRSVSVRPLPGKPDRDPDGQKLPRLDRHYAGLNVLLSRPDRLEPGLGVSGAVR